MCVRERKRETAENQPCKLVFYWHVTGVFVFFLVPPDLDLRRTDSSTTSLLVAVSEADKQKAKRGFKAGQPVSWGTYVDYPARDSSMHHLLTTR